MEAPSDTGAGLRQPQRDDKGGGKVAGRGYARQCCRAYLPNQFQHDQVGSFRAADEAGDVESRVARGFV